MQPRSLSRSWKRAAWMRRLSGLTCSPSTLDAGVAAWIASLPVSPASRTASPANAKASTTSGGSGPPSSESFATLVRGSWCSKTCADFFRAEAWTPFSLTWPASGSLRNGQCWQRPKLAPRTAASASSLSAWPTARGTGLVSEAAQWPTPASRDHKGENSATHVTLTGGGRKHMDQLPNFVMMNFSPPDPAIHSGPQSSPSGLGSRRRLNPAFVAWLMGLPWWWMNPGVTNSAQAEMESYRCRLRRQLSALSGD